MAFRVAQGQKAKLEGESKESVRNVRRHGERIRENRLRAKGEIKD